MRLLLAGSLLVPVLLFAAASWLNYRTTWSDAERELLRTSEVACENAAKVFDGQSQVADRVADLVAGMNSDAIAASEPSLHAAFASIVARLPQVQSVLLADRSGRPLVSALNFPVPADVTVKERDYFKAVMGGFSGTYVSSLQVGDVNRQPFFGLARPWISPDATLAGVIDVAVSPVFFTHFYKALLGENDDKTDGRVITLIRDDGQILVRYPPIAGPPPRASHESPFAEAIRANPDGGRYESNSIVDGRKPRRLFVFRKVEGYPVYVVAGRDRAAIVASWRGTMASHLVFGLPATLALFVVTGTALVRARREEQALAQAHREMGRRQVAEEALLRSQRLEAVGQMTGGVAHDFNNLLTVILGSAEMLARRADNPVRVGQLADQISVAARRGGEVTQQLLAFSRRQLVKPETIDLNRCLLDFKPLLDRAAQETVRVDLDLGAGLHPVRLDPGHFEAAVLNLVGNARDAMPEGGRIVIVTDNLQLEAAGRAELPPGAYARVAVTDTGGGMDPAIAAKAFEPFFTTKGVGKGTGLGLSQVYGFAKQAGGDARIVTAPGRGTTVELLLPRTAVAPSDAGPSGAGPSGTGPGTAPGTATPLPSPAPDEPGLDGTVVLVVEDEPCVLGAAVESLRDLGCTTVSAENAHAALSRLRTAERIDVLFSDVMMPGGMSGLQLADEARRLRPDLRVLLTSGYTGGFDTTAARDVPLLTKPYDRGQLAARLLALRHPTGSHA